MTSPAVADIILRHGNFTTLDKTNPAASAVAVKDDSSSRWAAKKK